jgi:hypothetical protein
MSGYALRANPTYTPSCYTCTLIRRGNPGNVW